MNLQERDSMIDKLRSGMQELSLKCEAVTARAEAAQPYERRYRDLQAGPPPPPPSFSHACGACKAQMHLLRKYMPYQRHVEQSALQRM